MIPDLTSMSIVFVIQLPEEEDFSRQSLSEKDSEMRRVLAFNVIQWWIQNPEMYLPVSKPTQYVEKSWWSAEAK